MISTARDISATGAAKKSLDLVLVQQYTAGYFTVEIGLTNAALWVRAAAASPQMSS